MTDPFFDLFKDDTGTKLENYILQSKNQADFNTHDLNPQLAEAIRKGKPECVRVLLKHGADPNYMKQFQTMMELCVTDGRGNEFLILWQNGGRVMYDPNLHRVLTFVETLGGINQLLSWLVSVDNVYFHSPSTFPQTFAVTSGKTNVMDVLPLTKKVEIWTQILQNDDVDLLRHYCENNPIWLSSSTGNQPLENAQEMSVERLFEIFLRCENNSHGIWTWIKRKYEKFIKEGNFEGIARRLSGLTDLNSEECEVCDSNNANNEGIFTSITHSLTFLALLTGRFNVLEELLRRRQFDILPATMLIILIIKKLMKMSETSIIQEGNDRLEELMETLKNMLEEAVKRMSHLDNEGVIRGLQVPLKFYGGLSILDLADRSCCDKLLSLPCCQSILADRWRTRTKITSSSDSHSVNYREPSLLQQFGSPRFKFWCHSALHLIFLICFSIVLVREFHFTPTGLEIFCFIFVLTYGLEVAITSHFLLQQRGVRFFLRQERYWVDFGALIVTLIGFFYRLTFIPGKSITMHPFQEAESATFYTCRVLLLIGLLLFYIRLLPILSINKVLGPRLTMMRNMLLKDLLPLLSVFLVLLLSFGIVIQSLLYPNGQTSSNATTLPHNQLHYIFQRTFYGMFAAEYPLEELKCSPGENSTCPNEMGSRLVLYAFHATFVFAVNVTLINLLIALFSNTVSNIAAQSRSQWLAAQYELVETYKRHSLLPPPLNIFTVVIHLIKCCTQNKKTRIPSKDRVKSAETKQKEILLHFLIIQAFALRGQRNELGSVKQRWEREISALRQHLDLFLSKEKLNLSE